MARFDNFIGKLIQDKGEEIIFETGANVVIRTGATVVPIMKVQLTTPQILGTLTEVAPQDARAKANRGEPFSYLYDSPHGQVEVTVTRNGNALRGVVRPEAAAKVEDFFEATPPEASPGPPGAGASPVAAHFTPTPSPTPAPLPLRASPSFPRAAPPAPAAQPIAPAPPVGRASAQDPRAFIDRLLEVMLAKRASDVHLSSDNIPIFRIDGEMMPQKDYEPLGPDRLREVLFSIAPEKNRKQFDEIHDTDFAHETEAARFRVNFFSDRKGIGAVLRQIPNNILTAEQMNLSKAVLDLCFLPKGLVLVTGPTGSGKSTTLAAIIDYINRNRTDHIITIEDPIEFVHANKKCLVNQREVGVHTGSFKHALRAALREDPDIVLVGEMRDLETIAIAIETAETGHLVFGTLHTNTAPSTVDRVIDQFPADRQAQIRVMLSESLKAVVSQTLCKKIGGGRVPALEILLCTPAVSNLIREGKTYQILSSMQTAKNIGMSVMNESLLELVKKKIVDPKEAFAKSLNKADFKQLLEREGFRVPQLADAAAA
ncbi:MAG TPA: type IV pilus twitching motility protein PilT [Myxococcales bacterium]|nr:type IV pilus twitching motility protein PilT [Myxococcales bacterium]